MKLTIRGKNIEITDALREYVQKRIGKIDKYFAADADAQVTLSVERGLHKVEVTAGVNGLLLRAEEDTGDMYASIDMVVEKLERQIAKYKTRINRKSRQGGGIRELSQLPKVEEEDEFAVSRRKRFGVKPMPVEEAILQMNLLGHDFYVFANAENDEMSVVYRRKDGKYGLIEPTLK
ncbi:MAG: ribosome-associated translation inhibitor RaiA [Dethiobacter sp.]|jgi:putative sigma-54 modulation protein|nr:ribosome-associated translation inhibitor RaiA [Dethiobacter sp.]MBS3898414.1 ribosome-associated translation inhibitor RaiA [Dethiobacter sp.]MBS3983112.1 ribosome-associated translation inhibitor RaiA [Dethiobacter sp.]MCL4462273.1 ribosome-associated translation inhibitor RaiA [Bacillota bacterium]MCL5993854.1 ribosome-associated translation inhibitor RaiA [Bacillota bacterium]